MHEKEEERLFCREGRGWSREVRNGLEAEQKGMGGSWKREKRGERECQNIAAQKQDAQILYTL